MEGNGLVGTVSQAFGRLGVMKHNNNNNLEACGWGY